MGLPRYEGQNRLRLDGGELLVAVNDLPEAVTVGGIAYSVTRMRPRIDQSLDRIERWVRADGDVHWRVSTGEGGVAVYGQSSIARIADPARPDRIFSWLIERTYDVAGNCTAYVYKPEDMAGVMRRPSEQARFGESPVTNRYLKRVLTGAMTPYDPITEVLPDFAIETVFDYGEHADPLPSLQEEQPWAVRADAFSDRSAGFDRRTYRLCRRVFQINRFAALGPIPAVTRLLALRYDLASGHALLSEATAQHAGPDGLGDIEIADLPTQRFSYGTFAANGDVTVLRDAASAPLTSGEWGQGRAWADLYGTGLPGLLTDDGRALRFSKNHGGGQFGTPQPLTRQPAGPRLNAGLLTLEDVTRSGRVALVVRDGPVEGVFQLDEDGDALPLQPFESRARPAAGQDGHAHLADFSGDGFVDLLVTGQAPVQLYQGLQGGGHAAPQEVPIHGGVAPVVLRGDARVTVQLADMTGDGLADLVEITAGQLRYWPGLGHGQFGSPVTMENVPLFASPDGFDANQLRLADLDGTGMADLIQVGDSGFEYALNRQGNEFGPVRLIGVPDLPEPLAQVRVLDLMGAGVPSILWESVPGGPLKAVTPAGALPPYRMTGLSNGAGLEFDLHYESAVALAEADAANGSPWRARPPFPVLCLTEINSRDLIAGIETVERYGYAHAVHDPVEREFVGFARVDRWNGDAADITVGASGDPLEQPVLYSRTWYDTGLTPNHPIAPEKLAAEWWQGDIDRRPTTPGLPVGLNRADQRAGYRSRKGQLLRQETYGLDGTASAEVPLALATTTQSVVVLQASPLVVRVIPAETVDAVHEGQNDDPFVTHSLALEHDVEGFTTLAATVGYGRAEQDATLPQTVRMSQARNDVELAQLTHTPDRLPNGDDRRYLLRRAWQRRGFQIEGAVPAATLFTHAEVLAAFAAAPAHPFEAPRQAVLARRDTTEIRDRYLSDDLSTELAFGALGRLPFIARRYRRALTPSLRADIYGADLANAERAALGYHDLDGDGTWWARSGRQIREAGSAARFLQADLIEDASGGQIRLSYDAGAFFATAHEDPLGTRAEIDYDYRLLEPLRIRDANGTEMQIAYDTRGMIVARAVVGPNGEGDTLADPGERVTYDPLAFQNGGTPPWLRLESRAIHGDPGSLRHVQQTYYDGSGGVTQLKVMDSSGIADRIGFGGLEAVDTGAVPRWLTASRARRNRLGGIVASFDPWYSTTDAYETDPQLTMRAGNSVMRLDALGRPLGEDHPDGTLTRTVFAPWKTESSDANDTVLQSSWFIDLGAPDPAGPEPANDAIHAAWVTAPHAGTPTESHIDPAGRALLDREPLGGMTTARSVRTEASPGGHLSQAFDSADRLVTETRYDLAGRGISSFDMEASGSGRLVLDGAGRPVRSLRPDGTVYGFAYDTLGRPVTTTITPTGGALQVISVVVYGEAHGAAGARNLRGRLFAQFDGSGVTIAERFDFKGQMVEATKRFLVDPSQTPDWGALVGLGPEAALAVTDAQLSAEHFTSRSVYDAHGRAIQTDAPDGTQARMTFGLGGTLERLRVTPPGGAAQEVLTEQSFDAWGGRATLSLGDGTVLTTTRDSVHQRVIRERCVRASDGRALLDAAFSRDPVGNVTALRDQASADVYFNNAVISGDMRFGYDALYQLTRATGRELAALSPTGWQQVTGARLPHANDTNALHRWVRNYTYDTHGNMTEMQHSAGGTGWRRRFRYAAASNQLEAVSAPGDAPGIFSISIGTDSNGRVVSLPNLPNLSWSDGGQLVGVDLGGGGAARYVLGGGGGRVQKIISRAGGIEEEWLYLGALELKRRRRGGVLIEERTTYSVLDGGELLARCEVKRVDTDDPTGIDTPLWRFRRRDQTGSILVETDAGGALIHHETYHPFGTTAYRSSTSVAEVQLSRFRYAARETDAETGLVHFGARYYAPWLARWLSPDPAGPRDGPNLYAFALNDPIGHRDPTGLQSAPAETRPAHADWSYETLKQKVKEAGRTMGSNVTKNNYKEFWNPVNQTWAVLIPVGETEGEATPGKGGKSDNGDGDTKATGPPDTPGKGDGKSGGEGDAKEGTGNTDGSAEGDAKDGSAEGADGKTGGSGNDQSRHPADVLRKPGASAVAAYNAIQREAYSKGNVKAATGFVNKIDDAIAAKNSKAAWDLAEEANDARNKARAATQNKMKFTGGKALAEKIELDRSFDAVRKGVEKGKAPPKTFPQKAAWKFFTKGLPTPNPTQNPSSWQAVTRNIAIGSGKTNRALSAFSKGGKILGPIGTVVGVGIGYHRYHNAAPEDKAKVAAGETASFFGGMLGYALGSMAGVALVALCVSNPVGWMFIAGSIVGGVAGAVVVGETAKFGTESLFD